MSTHLQNLTAFQRWALYFVVTGLPGLCIFRLFGWPGSIAYEFVMWIPQQRFFDKLQLAATIPFANLPTAQAPPK